MSKQRSTLLPKTATVSNEFIVNYRPFDKFECCFDIVAVFGNSVAFWATMSLVLATMSNEFFVKFRPFHKVEIN